jgi:hypothetical protein
MAAVINSLQIKNALQNKTPLLRKASKTFLIAAMVLMALSAVALFFYTQGLLKNEIEEELYSNKERVEKLLIEDQSIKGIPPIITVEQVEKPEGLTLKDTLIYDPLQDEIELFRELSETREIADQHYRITVRAMVIESEDILFAIIFTFISIIFFAFIFLFYFIKSRNEKLWQPFFINLDRLKNFSVKSDKLLTFEDSEILEFHELNREMETLTAKIQNDYRNLKQFTEDVSHEMQTPLAIMQARIDTVMNDEFITERQFEHLSKLQSDILRLKQLNKKLILLAKIENNQFNDNEPVSINEIISQVVTNFQELTPIEFIVKVKGEVEAQMDRSLAIILCNNLLSNATKHNFEKRPITIHIGNNTLQVINAGTTALEKPDQVFERFYKENKKPDSTGLGLSIVKKICDCYGFIPSYLFHERKHIFQINFNK